MQGGSFDMENRLSVVVLILATFAAAYVETTYAVEVKVYYESQSTEWNDFIRKQLYPTFMAVNSRKTRVLVNYESKFNSYMTVKLVPFGTVFKLTQTENGTWQLECNIECAKSCLYNKYEACATHIAKSPWTSLNYINSLVTTGYANPRLSARQTCFDDQRMPSCVNTVDGDEILIGLGHQTRSLNVTSSNNLPVVTFDGIYREEEQRPARENLLSVICEKTRNVPPVCAEPRAKQAMNHRNFGTEVYYPEKVLCEYN